MREALCFLCRSANRTSLFKQQGTDPYLKIVFGQDTPSDLYWCVCNECGFVYRSPILDEAESAKLYEHYEADIFKNKDPDEYFDRIVSLPDAESENVQKTFWLEQMLDAYVPEIPAASMSVLDVGCGGGTLLYTVCRKLGFKNLSAVELNRSYADLAAKRLSADVRCQMYEPGMFSRCFDLVICTKVLEHVAGAEHLLADMAEDLTEEGLLFLEVPDVSDVYLLPPDHDRFYIPHLYFFSANTLGALLNRVGLSILARRTVVTPRHRAYLQIVAQRAEHPVEPEPPYDDPADLKRKVETFQSAT